MISITPEVLNNLSDEVFDCINTHGYPCLPEYLSLKIQVESEFYEKHKHNFKRHPVYDFIFSVTKLSGTISVTYGAWTAHTERSKHDTHLFNGREREIVKIMEDVQSIIEANGIPAIRFGLVFDVPRSYFFSINDDFPNQKVPFHQIDILTKEWNVRISRPRPDDPYERDVPDDEK